MRKLLFCVPMMILLLAACGGGSAGGSEEETLALAIRGEYLEMTSCAATAEITADYGQRVYQYTVSVEASEEETALVITAPETVAGITARLKDKDSLLEYDGIAVEPGPMNQQGLTPVSAVPALLEETRSGYMRACALEEDGTLLRMDCGDPEGEPGKGVETTLWFDADTHALARGEIRVDGFRAILCEFTQFTKE